MYARAFTAKALGFLAEKVAEEEAAAIVQCASSKDDVEKQMAAWEDVDDFEFENWEMSGTSFLAEIK